MNKLLAIPSIYLPKRFRGKTPLILSAVFIFNFTSPVRPANFYKVDDILYRGGYNRKGIEKLKSSGVKTIISLRGKDKAEEEEKLAKKLGINFLQYPFKCL
ncbi:hypothetical protein J7L36_01630 [bacterium]|nr:hypothetical protein [bacterium]